MNDAQVITQFRDLVAKFKQNEKCFGLAAVNVLQGNVKEEPVYEAAFKNTYNVVMEIKEKLAQYDILQIPDLTLRLELIAIRENKDFSYFEILKILNNDAEEGLNFTPEINRDEWWNMLQEEILSQVNPDMLIRRKIDLGPLLVGKAVPEHLRSHLAQIKECYTWGFKGAASIYCRVILEEGFREGLKSKPEFGTPPR